MTKAERAGLVLIGGSLGLTIGVLLAFLASIIEKK